jgi:glycine/D-amino acid oxidase-like deaminating enzyme
VGVSVKQVAVVGGGVIGAACARAAAQQGLSVTLFAPGPDAAAASAASAGMLAAQIEPDDEYLLPLAVRGRDLYEDLAAALKDITGIDIGFQRTGITSVAFAADEAAASMIAWPPSARAGCAVTGWTPRSCASAGRGLRRKPLAHCTRRRRLRRSAALAAALQADARRLGQR